MKKRPWTTKEIAYLRDNRNKMTSEQLAKNLGRTKLAVDNMLLKQGIKKEVLFKVLKKGETLAIGTADECAEILNVSRSAIFIYATPYSRKRAIKHGRRYAVRL